jgi:hypothetical protein
MNVFISDLWADLREKRLWPVAVLLLIGLVTVPLVVATPAQVPTPQGPGPDVTEAKLPDAGVKVLAAADTTGRGSALDLFDPKDPFRPPESVLSKGDEASAPAGSSTAAGPSSSDSGAGSDAGSGTTGGTGGTGGSGGGGSAPRQTTRTEQFTYVIDVTFRRNSRTRRIKGLKRLDMLPSQATPLLIFMGVGSGGNNAVFLVDSTLRGAGEGKCKPSNSECSFLVIGAGSEHEFTGEDDDSYMLRVDQIRRVKVRAASANRTDRERGASAGDSSAGSRRFVPPLLGDLIEVATTSSTDSRGRKARR